MSCCGGRGGATYNNYNSNVSGNYAGQFGVTPVDRGSLQGVAGASGGNCVGACAPDANSGSSASLPGVILIPDPTTGALRIVATQACKSAFTDQDTMLVNAAGRSVAQLSPFGVDATLVAARGSSCCQIKRHF